MVNWSTTYNHFVHRTKKKNSLIYQKHYSLNNTYKDKKVRGNRIGVSLTEVAGEH